MRKDTTKKFLMRENRFRGVMISNEIRELLTIRILNGKGFDTKFNYLTQDTIIFTNMMALRHTSKDTSNKPFFITKDKIKNIVVNDKSEYVTFNMVYCESGTFTMGHIKQEDNKPRPETIERPFLLGETEVTQELYEKVMKKNPSKFQNPQNPIERVSWYDAILFCNELSKLQGLDECYVLKDVSTEYTEDLERKIIVSAQVTYDSKKNGYRLPEEKEWEYAAKAGTENQWAGTDDESKLKEYAWYRDDSYSLIHEIVTKWGFRGMDMTEYNSYLSTHPVKMKKPNEWGFYDMTGNVAEWCWDKDNPESDASKHRVVRGGSWNNSNASLLLHSASRGIQFSSSSYNNFGFRICRTI